MEKLLSFVGRKACPCCFSHQVPEVRDAPVVHSGVQFQRPANRKGSAISNNSSKVMSPLRPLDPGSLNHGTHNEEESFSGSSRLFSLQDQSESDKSPRRESVVSTSLYLATFEGLAIRVCDARDLG